ncbi:MAG: peptidoglycan binding domain-containing protein [Eubacteriales bacterium]|nr:peptidoglycan binding domain-containing protein [Eubacteriales bacterium]
MSEEKNEGGTGRLGTILLILILLILIAAAYVSGLLYFQGHFLPGTEINGFRCDFKTPEEAENLLDAKVQAYELAVVTRGNGVEGMKASEMGLSYEPKGEVEDILRNQKRTLWFASLGKHQEYTAEEELVYDETLLEKRIQELNCMQPANVEQPRDASVEQQNGEYVIIPEKEGTTLIYGKLKEAIVKAMLSGEREVHLEEEGCYQEPMLRAEDPVMQENLEFVKTVMDVMITYDFADKVERVDSEKIAGWIVPREDGKYELDSEIVKSYVEGLAEKYNTGSRAREFRKYDGTVITVSGGDYGWNIDVEQETQALIEAIVAGNTQVREPIYTESAFSRDTRNDIGYTYIEIDLTAQKLVWYVDGQPLVETGIVSGVPGSSDTATPTGVYSLKEKSAPYNDGRDQTSVNWYLNFCENYGIHDAPGRVDFSFGAYVDQGTWGCIEVPSESMQTIYQGAEVGTPVIIY